MEPIFWLVFVILFPYETIKKTTHMNALFLFLITALCFGLFRLFAYFYGIPIGFGFGGMFSTNPFIAKDFGVFIFDLLNSLFVIGIAVEMLWIVSSIAFKKKLGE